LDWERYKQICDTPNVFSRWMLEQTSELTSEVFSTVLRQTLQSAPVPKPDGHRGGAVTDMFELTLSQRLVDDIAGEVHDAAATSRTTSGTKDRGLGGFSEAWNEYAEFLKADSLSRNTTRSAQNAVPSGMVRR
jgi:hypothetical protein